MNIVNSFKNAFARMEQKNWNYIYILIDIHGTIFVPSYHSHEDYLFYPYAKECLQLLSKIKNIKIILWSCTKRPWFNDYYDILEKNNIHVDYCNENPEVVVEETDPDSLSFDEKFYYNVGLDDKFGFEPNVDWKDIYEYLINNFNLNK